MTDARWRALCLERDNYRCLAAVDRRCAGVAQHVHHRKLRKHSTKAERVDLDNGVSICLNCHDWVHAHFPEAKELGLRISREDDIYPYEPNVVA